MGVGVLLVSLRFQGLSSGCQALDTKVFTSEPSHQAPTLTLLLAEGLGCPVSL